MDAKNDAEKETKMMPKGFQKSKIMTKWMPTLMKIHTFLKKAEILETICFTIENVVLGT